MSAEENTHTCKLPTHLAKSAACMLCAVVIVDLTNTLSHNFLFNEQSFWIDTFVVAATLFPSLPCIVDVFTDKRR
jgi:hypothetical protein